MNLPMGLNFIDIIVIGAVIVFAYSGYRQGFVAALASFIGFIGGGLIGAYLAPRALEQVGVHGGLGFALTVALVLGLAVAGQMLTSLVGRRLRERITFEPVRVIDSAGGAVLNVLALAVIAWILAATAAAVPSSPVSVQVQSSSLLAGLDRLVPNQARGLVIDLRGLVDDSGLPQLFDSFGVLPPAPVGPPTPAVVGDPQVQAALNSVVRVEGSAPSCNAGFTGSGFIVGTDRVLTNAHVLAGVRQPTVHAPGNSYPLAAETIYFDPKTDLAVLRVPGLNGQTLGWSRTVSRGDNAVIAGYPGGGPMTATAARVRGKMTADLVRGTDIYGRPGVNREIYALRGKARPGNSGGPLLTEKGTVAGVVFAQSQGDPNTAFALTAESARNAVRTARGVSASVSTGGCARS